MRSLLWYKATHKGINFLDGLEIDLYKYRPLQFPPPALPIVAL